MTLWLVNRRSGIFIHRCVLPEGLFKRFSGMMSHKLMSDNSG